MPRKKKKVPKYCSPTVQGPQVLITLFYNAKYFFFVVHIVRLTCLVPSLYNLTSNHRFLTYSTKEKLGELYLSEYNYFLTKI